MSVEKEKINLFSYFHNIDGASERVLISDFLVSFSFEFYFWVFVNSLMA